MENAGTGFEPAGRFTTKAASGEATVSVFSLALEGEPPRHFRLEMGSDRDTDYLDGDWHGPERAGMWPDGHGARMRWSGAKAGVHLAIDPDRDATLILNVHVPSHALAGPNQVLVNGAVVGRFDKTGTRTYHFAVPRAILAGRPMAELSLQVHAWRPADFGQGDTRSLGVAVRSVEICSQGAEAESPVAVALRATIDWNALSARYTRRLGKGATLSLPASGRADTLLAQAVVEMLTHPERLLPDAKGIELPAAEPDGVYATVLSDGVLLYNSSDQPRTVAGIEVPAHGIGWRKR
jgi:hypothetical protein